MLHAFIRHGFIPDSLVLTTIVPILKSKRGDIISKDNYRLITNSYSYVMNSRIMYSEKIRVIFMDD